MKYQLLQCHPLVLVLRWPLEVQVVQQLLHLPQHLASQGLLVLPRVSIITTTTNHIDNTPVVHVAH